MSTFEHWAHRLYPKFTFDDCLEKIESLGHKREIQVNVFKNNFRVFGINKSNKHVSNKCVYFVKFFEYCVGLPVGQCKVSFN